MIVSITETEREKRLKRIREEMRSAGYKAMLFVADSYLGKKGSLRYIFDNHLIHRYGYGLVFEDGQYQILPSGLHYCTDPRVPDTIFPQDHEILEIGRQFRHHGIISGTIGVVGLNNTMKLEDFTFLKNELPGIDWVDATFEFEKVRAIKSEAEIEGIIETNRIIEAGFDSIVERIKPGMTEEEAVSYAYQAVHALGAKDTLFLTLSSSKSGAVEPVFLNPRPRVIRDKDYLIVSLEITGPTGHWVEHSRMFCFGERDEEMERLASIVADGIAFAEREMKPGVDTIHIQEGLDRMAKANGYDCGHLTGHGIGMDVIERPFVARRMQTSFVGVENPGDGDNDLQLLRPGMVISYHPQIVKPGKEKSAYMSDVFVIRENGAQRLSSRNHDVIFIQGR